MPTPKPWKWPQQTLKHSVFPIKGPKVGNKVLVLEISLSPLTLLSCSGRRSDKTRRVRGLAMVDRGGSPGASGSARGGGGIRVRGGGAKSANLTRSPWQKIFFSSGAGCRRCNSCARERERKRRGEWPRKRTPKEKEEGQEQFAQKSKVKVSVINYVCILEVDFSFTVLVCNTNCDKRCAYLAISARSRLPLLLTGGRVPSWRHQRRRSGRTCVTRTSVLLMHQVYQFQVR